MIVMKIWKWMVSMVLLCLGLVIAQGTIPSMFEECDADKDHSLTAEELSVCLGLDKDRLDQQRVFHPLLENAPFGTNVKAFIKVMDKNNDGIVQWDEYADAIRAIKGEKGFPRDRRKQHLDKKNEASDKMNTRRPDSSLDANLESETADQGPWFDDEDDGQDEVHDRSAPDAVKLTRRDGSTEYISQKELFDILMINSQEHAKMKGQLDDDEDDEMDFHALDEDLHRNNPGVSHMSQLAIWAVERLKNQNLYPDPPVVQGPGGEGHRKHVFKPRFPKNALLLRAKSLPVGGSPNRDLMEGNATSDSVAFMMKSDVFEVYLEIAVQPNGQKNGPRSSQRSYEISVERNPELYRYPYLAIRGVWQLSSRDGSGGYRKNELELPIVRLQRVRDPDLPNSSIGDLRHAWNTARATVVDMLSFIVDFTVDILTLNSNNGNIQQDPNLVLLVVLGWTTVCLAALYMIVLPLLFRVLQLFTERGFHPNTEHEHED